MKSRNITVELELVKVLHKETENEALMITMGLQVTLFFLKCFRFQNYNESNISSHCMKIDIDVDIYCKYDFDLKNKYKNNF